MAATDARPVPRKNAAFRFYFAIRKNDGTLITSWTGADSEVSIDGASFSGCTNEATEIGSSGCGYIDLTSSEMNGDSVVLKITVSNASALPLVVTFFPEEIGDYRVNVEQFGGANGTFSSGRPEVNTTHWAGTAVGSANVRANIVQCGGNTVAAGAIPNAAAGGNGGLPTVNASNYIAGMQGTLNTLDALDTAQDTQHSATQTLVQDVPTNSEFEARTLAAASYATASALSTVDSVVDAIKVTTDKLDDTLEDDDGTFRFTVNALEQAPSGGEGGSTDWTADERTAIRAILGIPGSGTTPADPSSGILDSIRDAVAVVDGNVDSILEDTGTTIPATLATIAGYVDTEIGTIGSNVVSILADTNELQSDWANGGRLDVILDSRASQTSVDTIDSVVDAIKLITDQLPEGGSLTTLLENVAAILQDTGTDGVVIASASKTGFKLASDGLDSIVIESGITASAALVNDNGEQLTSINLRQAAAVIASALAGVLSGVSSNEPDFKPVGKPAGSNRIEASTEPDGRTSILIRVPV